MQKQNLLSWVLTFRPWPSIDKLYFLKKKKNVKRLLPGLKIHRLSRRKEVLQMLDKLNPGSSNNEIGLQNKSWACMVAFSMRISNHIRKGIPVYAAIDNNDGVQETLKRKDTTYETNMTLFNLFAKICSDVFLKI